MSRKGFAGLVQEKLKEGALSLRALCRASGVDPSYLSKVLQGKRAPPGDEKVLRRMAKALEVDPAVLMISASPEFIRKVFAANEKPKGKAPGLPSRNSVKQTVYSPVKSPQLSEDLL